MPLTAEDVRRIVKEEIESAIQVKINPSLQKLQEDVKKITELSQRVEDVEQAAQFTSDRLDDLCTKTLPSITQHIESVACALVKHQLDLDVHSWTSMCTEEVVLDFERPRW